MPTPRIVSLVAFLVVAAIGISPTSGQETPDYTVEQAIRAFSCESVNRSTLPDGSCGSRFADSVPDAENSRFIGIVGKGSASDSGPAQPAIMPSSRQGAQLTKSNLRDTPIGFTPLPQLPGARDLQIEFLNDSDELTKKAMANAMVFAEALNSPSLKNLRFAIDGHANATGSAEYNEGLSLRRAQAVIEYLVSLGVKRSRLDLHGYGFMRPVNVENPQADENRRVEARRLDIASEANTE